MSNERILVVEDETRIAQIVSAYLQRDGYRVLQARDGRAALEMARAELPDLIVLDLMLPEVSGWDVTRELRRNPRTARVSIIMATARDEVSDRIVGLELGADDYIVKPYDAKELVARVHAVLRRANDRSDGGAQPAPILQRGELVIDRNRYEVRRGTESLPLTRTEFEILATLAAEPGRVFSRMQLLDAVQGEAFEGYERSIDSHVKNLRRQLVADIAHELRTPLMVVNATVEAIQDGVLPADQTNLATIRDEVASLARLVSDLRDLSLGDVGQFPIEREPVDLGNVLDSVGAAFATAAAARGIILAVEVSPDLPRVLGDDARLRQCVRNLVDNALRHTTPGGQVAPRARAADGGVEIAVSDTGEGIAPENLPRVFERFFRADQSRNRRSGGSGLGLAIVQQIVHAHGGEITVASAGLGQGATFTMTLPAVGAEETAALADAIR